MRWNRLPKLPAASDLREAACLLILSAAMIFSVLNIGVHRLAEPLWGPINHGLSPDSNEYISISLAGIRVHDVDTGGELQRVTWRSPWLELFRKRTSEFAEDYPHIADYRSPNPRRNYTIEIMGAILREDSEARVTVEVSPTNRYVIGNFPAGYAVWWNRSTNETKVHYFTHHLPLRCFLDEPQDRIYFECLRIPKPLFQPTPSEWSLSISSNRSNYLSRTLDVIEFRLSDAMELATYRDRAMGAPVDNNPQLRLVADENGENLALQHWNEFPRGEPLLVNLLPVEGIPDLGDCRAERTSDGVTLLEASEKGIFELKLGHCQSTRRLVQKATALSGLAPFRSAGLYFYQDDAASHLVIHNFDKRGSARCFDISWQPRWRDAIDRNRSSAAVTRIANEYGQVLDLPRTTEGRGKAHQISLEPYPSTFAASLFVSVGAFGIWLLNAWRSKTLLRSNSWLVLVVGCIWPVVCWLVDLSLELPGAHILFVALNTVILSLCTGSFFTRGSLARTTLLATTTLIAMLFVNSFRSY